MTVIRPNGISGVTSITSSGDAINFYRSDGTLGPELGINVNVTSGVSTFAALNVTGVLTYEDVASVDSVGIITARSTIDAKGDISIADKIIHTGDTNTAIRFPAADTITAETGGSERVRITSAGNFGVGTNSPATPLVVSNSGAEGWELGYTSGTVELVGYNRSGSARSPMKIIGQTFLVQTGNPSLSNGLYQDANGKVLIGTQTTSSYADRLLTVGNTSHTSPTIEIRSATNGQPGLVFSDSTAGDVNSYRGTIEYNHASNYMMFRTDAVERIRITSAGNFGIGTQSPLVPFVVSDGAIRNIEMGYSSGLTNNYIQSYNRSTSAYMGLTIAASPLSFQIGSTEVMKIDSSGNVGINESSPSSYAGSGHQLVVSDASSACGMTIRTSSSHAGNIFFSDGTSGTQLAEGYMQYNHAGNYLAFGTLNTERMRITSAGNVEITDGNLTFANGHGIDFSSSSNASGMASELLDDYEEGTFTPAFPGTTSISPAPTGHYVLVGSKVTVWINITNATVGGTHNGTISDLPFSGGSHRAGGFSISAYHIFNTADTITAVVESGQTNAYLLKTVANSAWASVGISPGSNRYLHLTMTYEVY